MKRQQTARLDFFATSSDYLSKLNKTDIKIGNRTDHSLIYLEVNLGQEERGRGYWKFNISLLRDIDYVNMIKTIIQEVKDSYKDNIQEGDITCIKEQILLEMIKLKVRGKSISYSSFKKKNAMQREQELQDEIELLEKCEGQNLLENSDVLEDKRVELESIRAAQLKASLVRTKLKYINMVISVQNIFSLEKKEIC